MESLVESHQRNAAFTIFGQRSVESSAGGGLGNPAAPVFNWRDLRRLPGRIGGSSGDRYVCPGG